MRTQLFPVPFYEDTLVLVDFEGEPYVVMRTVITNMGLSWAPQYSKLVEKFGSTVTEIVTVAEDGKLRPMVCLPLRKLPGWLYTVQPNKVAPALRDKVIRYQTECEEALYRYWMGEVRGRAETSLNSELSWLKERTKLLVLLSDCRHPATARGHYRSLRFVNDRLGIQTEEIEDLAPVLAQGVLPGMALA